MSFHDEMASATHEIIEGLGDRLLYKPKTGAQKKILGIFEDEAIVQEGEFNGTVTRPAHAIVSTTDVASPAVGDLIRVLETGIDHIVTTVIADGKGANELRLRRA